MSPSPAPKSRATNTGAQAVAFCFPVTWACVAEPFGLLRNEEKSRRQPSPVPVANPAPGPVSAIVPSPSPVREFGATPRPADSWEMVIPRSARPVARPARFVQGPVPSAIEAPKTVEVPKPVEIPKTVEAPQSAPVNEVGPNFEGLTSRDRGGGSQ